MEGITASAYRGLKEYWERKGYRRINRSGHRRRINKVELGNGTGQTRKARFWRWKIKLSPKIRINRIPSPKKLLIRARDAYVRMMMGLANSRVMTVSGSAGGFGGTMSTGPTGDAGFKRAPPKEYDEKMIIQIYKSILMTHGNLEVACRQ
ncbi:uncharacterized protein LOC131615124 [Vicia villosa]|uniref:uncharacterized protein LOC131615124 n=1 Tax=Vicia villosa TaxID=3911 RepID=UPI00273CD1DB|nr:uncharacterized protein LOC131615124 [Vicia villosa]